MIGWVPHVLVGFLDEVTGPETRREILANAGLDAEGTRFRLDTDVPDASCRRLIDAACRRLDMTAEQIFTLFAPYLLDRARADFPGFFRGINDATTFLLRQPTIHSSLATGLRDDERDRVRDKFSVTATPDGVRVRYNSQNRLATLYVKLAEQLAISYGERADVQFEEGGPEAASCVMLVTLSPAGRQAAAAPIAELTQAASRT